MEQWVSALLFLVICAVIPIAALGMAIMLGVKAKDEPPTRFDTYECGEVPDGEAWIQFHPRYYIVALVFVLFDVEVAFLFPWALNIRDFGMLAIIEMFTFLAVLMLGWFYALKKGALTWH